MAAAIPLHTPPTAATATTARRYIDAAPTAPIRLAASAMPVAIPGPKTTAAIARHGDAGRAVHMRDREMLTEPMVTPREGRPAIGQACRARMRRRPTARSGTHPSAG